MKKTILKEINLTNLIQERPIEETVIFNYDPTLKDIEDAYNKDQIIIFNCADENLDMVDTFIKSIPDEHKHSLAVYFWPIEKKQFEKLVIERLNSALNNPVMWNPPAGWNKG